jgi:hypothetical protein
MNNILSKVISVNRSVVKSSCGQLAIPAVLIVPMLLLFIYLLFETANISSEKIRQQFALDSAVFVEMTNYSDYLNRTAYVNGVFPHRLFEQAFQCPPDDRMIPRSDEKDPECMYDIFYSTGSYPKFINKEGNPNNQAVWKFRFEKRKKTPDEDKPEVDLNIQNPKFPEIFELMPHEKVLRLWLSLDNLSQISTIYILTYQMLGQLQQSQRKLYEDLTTDVHLLRKAYYLNAGSCSDSVCAEEAASSIIPLQFKTNLKFIRSVEYWGKVWEGDAYFAPAIKGKKRDPKPPGAFQLTVLNGGFDAIAEGITVTQSFDLGGNFFNVDLNQFDPQVKNSVTILCPQGDCRRSVWPDSTPHSLVRMYP